MRVATAVFLIALPVLSFLPPFAMAQGAQVAFGAMAQDSDQPVEVTSDALSVNQNDGTAIFTGNVIIGQGDMRLTAPRVLVVYVKGGGRIARLEATGGVTLVSGADAAEAQRADYDIDAGIVVMRGDVLLTQENSALSSQEMTVNLKDGTAQMSGRVKTVLQSGQQ